MMKQKALIFLTGVFLLSAQNGFAADEDFVWKASVGAMGFMAPKYKGSDKYEPYYLPMVDLDYGPFFASVQRGVGIYLPVDEDRTLIFAPGFRWRTKRNLGDSWGTLRYVENIRPTATLNTIIKLDPWAFNFRITDGLTGDNQGSSFNLGVTWQSDVGDRMHLTLYSTAIYGSQAYNQTYYGITDAESIMYGYAVHTPSAGLKSWDVGGLLKYYITEKVSLDFAFEYLVLVGPAAHSPITTDVNQIQLGIGATYKF